jgi:hypothetical protein
MLPNRRGPAVRLEEDTRFPIAPFSVQFGAPGHQGEKHAAPSRRRVHAGAAHVHQVQDDPCFVPRLRLAQWLRRPGRAGPALTPFLSINPLCTTKGPESPILGSFTSPAG